MAKGEFALMTPEQRRENGRKGGIASGESKRKKKALRERLEILLDMPMKSGREADLEAIKNFAELKGKNITVQDALMIAQIPSRTSSPESLSFSFRMPFLIP